MLEDYLEPDQIAEVYRAYLFGAEAHDGQSRKTGEPYIYHPVAVARILAEMRMDPKSLIAALLHDVIEDTPTAKEQLTRKFGEEVAELVDGVSKLDTIEFESKVELQAENFRKMMLAMTRDIRVILVKLADRLHNMRTLGIMRPDKRRRIARETLDIYAPIANRLGMNKMRLELEELGFEAAYPLRFRVIAERMKKARGNRKEIVTKIERSIKERLKIEGLKGNVIGREKHLYGIYHKMRTKHLPFNEVMDVYAFRIIVESVDMCYRILGAVHNLYKPVPGKFKDYIAIPKVNGYQSLHTVLFSPFGVPIEVQIRTEDMDKVAEAGIAAHWLYKSGSDSGNSAQVRARQWLLDVLEIQQHAGNSMEFLENVKIDLFPDEVYVFSPRGDIMELPRGATAVDFAYSVHTDVGNQCVAVKIDRRLMPLRTELRNGQTVEIITSPTARPNPVWLNFVHTAKARTNIRHFLKNLQQDEAIQLGERLINRCLEEYGLSIKDLPKKNTLHVLKSFKYKRFEYLLADVGLGNRMPVIMARLLAQGPDEEIKLSKNKKGKGQKPLAIKGTEGTVVNYAKCCHPIPGDAILGLVTAGRGVVIHRENCKNVAEYRNQPDKWIDVSWEDDVEGEFPVVLRTIVHNKRGVLATIAASISDMNANIENVSMDERDGQHSSLTFTVTVKDRKHLASIMRRLRNSDIVIRISRSQ
ncbi:MAG: bifunctional GTP diphosphokinase/guanosine-3',5'-bis pyrophosphate 3'-pyrophosphohydrolase [Thioalkalispiraceae bacterium]|jgi:RelA/SpoT family (p)ppGpp synthetase